MLIGARKELVEKIALFGGIIAVFSEWFAFLIFYLNSPSDFSKVTAISYFATLQQTRLTFAICLSVAALSFLAFTRLHLKKHFKASVKIFTLSMISYLLMAIVPYSPDIFLSDATHRALAMSFTISFILGIYLTAKNNSYKNIKIFSQTIAIITAILSLVLFFAHNRILFLSLELAVFFICQLWTVGITYLIYKIKSS